MKTGKKYKIIIEGKNEELTFTGEIIKEDADFITFKDKFGEVLSYNKNRIIYTKEVNE